MNTRTAQPCLPLEVTRRSTEVIRRALITHADEILAEYPQYAGHHDDWIVVRVRDTVGFKGGSTLHPGVYYLAEPEPRMRPGERATWTVFDHVSGHHVGCPPEHLKAVL